MDEPLATNTNRATATCASPTHPFNSAPLFIMSKYTAFRCPEDLLELAKIKAKKDRRSLSNYIITLIEKDVQDEVTASAEEAKGKRK
jgi:hypothetical protein